VFSSCRARCRLSLLSAAALFVALTLQASPRLGAHADTRERCLVEPRYEFYQVEGANLEQIRAALRQKGPRDENGKGRFAYTDWSVKWGWRKLDNGGVDPQSVKLECRATILLPRLKPSVELSAESIKNWHSFVERTREHELAHLKHVELGAPRIVSALGQEGRSNSLITSARANQIARDVVASIREMDRGYDARTDHGRLEGTWSLERIG
jgi:predicted secreted Zn-dependent protease